MRRRARPSGFGGEGARRPEAPSRRSHAQATSARRLSMRATQRALSAFPSRATSFSLTARRSSSSAATCAFTALVCSLSGSTLQTASSSRCRTSLAVACTNGQLPGSGGGKRARTFSSRAGGCVCVSAASAPSRFAFGRGRSACLHTRRGRSPSMCWCRRVQVPGSKARSCFGLRRAAGAQRQRLFGQSEAAVETLPLRLSHRALQAHG